MLDVEAQLHTYAGAAADSVPAVTVSARPHRRRKATLVAAAVLVVLVVGVALLAARGGTDDVVTVGPDRPAGAGSWDEIPPAPIAGRSDEVAVATDDEMVIWGGKGLERFADGAAYSFAAGGWRLLAPSPLSPRSSSVAIWTGSEVIIWGGTDGTDRALRDGAAYDPATDSWRVLPAPPPGIRGRSDRTPAVWTGTDLVLVDVETASQPATVAFRPTTGAWRTLAQDVVPDFSIRRAVWSGSEILVTTALPDDRLTVDDIDPTRRAGTLAATGMAPSAPGLEVTADAIWTGTRLALVGLRSDGALIDQETGSTSPLPAAQTNNEQQFPTVLLDDGVITVGERWLDLNANTWHDTAAVPGPDRFAPVAVTYDGRYYVWGGSTCAPGQDCARDMRAERSGLIWTPPTSRSTTGSTSGSAAPAAPRLDGSAAFMDRLSDEEKAVSREGFDPAQQESFDQILGYFETDMHPVVTHSGVAVGFISTETMDEVTLPETLEECGPIVDEAGNPTGYWAGDLGAYTSEEVDAPGFSLVAARAALFTDPPG